MLRRPQRLRITESHGRDSFSNRFSYRCHSRNNAAKKACQNKLLEYISNRPLPDLFVSAIHKPFFRYGKTLLRIHKEIYFMQKYESVLIARQDLGASQVNSIVSDLSEVIKKEGGEVVRVDNWGLKTLAYRIKKNRKGHYVIMNISAPAAAIAEYERIMRFNEDIIRYMTIRVDEFSEGVASEEKEIEEAE